MMMIGSILDDMVMRIPECSDDDDDDDDDDDWFDTWRHGYENTRVRLPVFEPHSSSQGRIT